MLGVSPPSSIKIILSICLVWSYILGNCFGQRRYHAGGPTSELSEFSSNNRTGKFLLAVKFDPHECTGTDSSDEGGGGTTRRGVCYSPKQCTAKGGRASGSCAQGFGVCCIIAFRIRTNDESVRVAELAGTLRSSTGSFTGARTGRFEIIKQPNVCQVELDFAGFNFPNPTTDGMCRDASIGVSRSATVSGTLNLCGMLNANERLFFAYQSDSSMISVEVRHGSANTFTIPFRQILCSSRNRVPDDCLRMLPRGTGNVTSFAFPNFIVNPRHSICINSDVTNTQIGYTECPDTSVALDQNSFLLNGYFTAAAPANPDIRTARIPVTGEACTRLGLSYVEVVGELAHCGGAFQPRGIGVPVVSTARPFKLNVLFVPVALPPAAGIFGFGVAGGPAGPYTTSCPVAAVPPPAAGATSQGFNCATAVGYNNVNGHANTCICIPATAAPPLPITPNPRGFCLDYTIT